jgi:2'-hydroxyisoflavone reductase
MLKGIGSAIHSSAQLHWAPTDFLDKNNVQAWSDMPVWIPGKGDSAGFAHRNVHKAQKAGLTYRPLGTTAVDTLEWFRSQPAERQAKLKAGLAPEREKELLAALDKEKPKT